MTRSTCRPDPGHWFTIDTAPLDGTEVLLLIENPEHALVYREPTVSIGCFGVYGGSEADPTWCFAGWDWCHDVYTRGGGTPTHWMPLPGGAT